MNIKKTLGLVALTLVGFSACSDPDYMKYDSSYTGIYFTRDTLEYSFSVTPVEVRKHVLKVPVQIMGAPADVDRDFAFELISDSCTALDGEQYVIGQTVVMADSIHGYIPVEILRDGLEGDYESGYTRYQLGFRLVQNEHFYPTLSEKDQVRIVKFDNAVEQPDWRDAYGNKVWPVASLGTWHPFTLIKMVEYFHAFEAVNPETYRKIANAFGENLEHIPFGDPYPYRSIFVKYIYDPLYQYTNDPANKETILGMYPDYPFDFPNPYK